MNYEKSNLEKAPCSPIKKQTIKDKATAGIAIKEGAKGYKKEDGLRPARSFYVVISGGEKREKDYLRLISNQDLFQRLKIEFIADPKDLNPEGLLEIASIKKNGTKRVKTKKILIRSFYFLMLIIFIANLKAS